MSTGQGFTCCLICKDDSSLEFNNQLIQNIIKICYDTDEFNVMLQSTRMCTCCIGRFHQLYNFFMFKKSLEGNQPIECESPDLQCKFCYQVFMDFELMASEVNTALPKVVSKTSFSNDFSSDQHFKCCYACYNFLFLWTEYKVILQECRLKFYATLYNVEVSVLQNNTPNAVKVETSNESIVTEKINEDEEESQESEEQVPMEEVPPTDELVVEDNVIVQSVFPDTTMPEIPFDLSEFLVLNIPPAVQDEIFEPQDEEISVIPTIELTSNSATALEHSMPIATQYLSTNNHQPALNDQLPANKKEVRVLIHRLSTDTLEQLLDSSVQNENLPQRRRGRSLAQIKYEQKQLQDVNENVMKIMKKRKASPVVIEPEKYTRITKRKRIIVQQKEKVMTRKKQPVEEAKISITEDQQLLANFNIKPCSVIVKKLVIEDADEEPTPPPPPRTKKKKASRNSLKIKIARKGKKKVEGKVRETGRSKSVPLPVVVKGEEVLSQTKKISSQRSVSMSSSLDKTTSEDLAITESQQPVQQVDDQDFVLQSNDLQHEIHIERPKNQEPPPISFLHQQPGNFFLLNATETTYDPLSENGTETDAFAPVNSQQMTPKIVFRPRFRQKLVTKNGDILSVVSENANKTYISM